jgi:deferrochelatase/peroxidase EfeB
MSVDDKAAPPAPDQAASSRRTFLKGAIAGVAGTTVMGSLVARGVLAEGPAAAAESLLNGDTYLFHGADQAGILNPAPPHQQAASCFAAFDVVDGTSRADLVGLMHTLTARARFLTSGGTPLYLGVSSPPSDSDVVGPMVSPDGLTATLGLGASLFDDRFGLASQKPIKLTQLRAFPNDSPDPAWLHGDLSLQLCAYHPDTIHHAIRDITKHTRGVMQLRWKMDGYASPPRPSGTPRNLLGFKDGTANPTGQTAASLVWVNDPSEPKWAQGGSYQVVRLIRMLVEFWDRVSIDEQQDMFGRRRDSGAPLDGNNEFDIPNYGADPKGLIIPLDSHIRLANPRTVATAKERIVRRSYNYDLGIDTNGNLQTGHIFVAWQQDVKRQFETIQTRLIDEPLVDYVQPFGGGYFFAVPGVRNTSDWYASSLLTYRRS